MAIDVNSLAPESYRWDFTDIIAKDILVTDNWNDFCKTGPRWKPRNFMILINIGSSNGLVLSGTKPLLNPKLTKFSVAICYLQEPLS